MTTTKTCEERAPLLLPRQFQLSARATTRSAPSSPASSFAKSTAIPNFASPNGLNSLLVGYSQPPGAQYLAFADNGSSAVPASLTQMAVIPPPNSNTYGSAYLIGDQLFFLTPDLNAGPAFGLARHGTWSSTSGSELGVDHLQTISGAQACAPGPHFMGQTTLVNFDIPVPIQQHARTSEGGPESSLPSSDVAVYYLRDQPRIDTAATPSAVSSPRLDTKKLTGSRTPRLDGRPDRFVGQLPREWQTPTTSSTGTNGTYTPSVFPELSPEKLSPVKKTRNPAAKRQKRESASPDAPESAAGKSPKRGGKRTSKIGRASISACETCGRRFHSSGVSTRREDRSLSPLATIANDLSQSHSAPLSTSVQPPARRKQTPRVPGRRLRSPVRSERQHENPRQISRSANPQQTAESVLIP